MIRELAEMEQQEFDAELGKVKEKARHDYSIQSMFLMTGVRHYTNHVEIIPYSTYHAFVKASKFFSNLIHNGYALLDRLKGVRRKFMPGEMRHEHEAGVLEELAQMGVNVPEVIYTSVEGVVATRFYPAERTKIVLSDEERCENMLQQLSSHLGAIHLLGAHGDAGFSNTFVHSGRAYWADFERFERGASNFKKALDIARMIRSVSASTPFGVEWAANSILQSYPHGIIIDEVRKNRMWMSEFVRCLLPV